MLVYNYCYHGTVDRSLHRRRAARPSHSRQHRPARQPHGDDEVIEFNDIPALEAALAPGDVACTSCRAVMTSIGIIHPEPGYHDAFTRTRRTGTLLIIDETHTICTGPGGYTLRTGWRRICSSSASHRRRHARGGVRHVGSGGGAGA